MNDFRFALRALRRSPGFTTIAGLVLALGIGANTAVFSVIDAVLLRPLPWPDAERVVRVYNRWEGTPRASLSPAEYFDYRERTASVFSAFGVYATGALNVTGDGEPERVAGAFISAGALQALGMAPAAGRLFRAEEDAVDGPVAILADGTARRRFGRSNVVGLEIIVDGMSRTIVGVMPARFHLPTDIGGPSSEVFLPLGMERSAVTARGSHFLVGVARLAPGIGIRQATDRLEAIAADLVAAWPDDYPRDMRFGAHTVEMRDDIAGNVRPVLLVLLAAVGLVLLVACANVASLTLTRADARRREFALRTAVGAGRFHLVRQLIVESLTLATLGAIAGVLLATWAVSALLALQPQAVPLAGEIGLDTPVLLFALAITLLTALLSGLAPLVQQRGDPAAMLRESSRSTAAAPRQRFRRSLVTTELALAVVLLAGAGLLVRSFAGLLAVNPGYAVRNVLTTRISLPDARYPDDPTRRDFFTQLERRAAALPGVLAAGAVSNLPLANGLGDLNIRIEGREVREGEVSPRLDWQVVTPGWFDAMGLTLMMGRAIREDDDERAPGAVVINQSAAQLYFPNQDAIGQRFRLGGGAGPGWVTIVGIVADVRHGRLDDAPTPSMYLPHRQFTFWNGGLAANTMSLVVRTVAEPATLAPTLRNVISQLDPDVPAGAFRTMEEVRDSAVAQPRFVTTLILAFATIALLLAVVGIYGLISFTVGLRRQELGVRVALGAANRQILGLVLKDGLLTVGSGLGIGAVAALVLTRGLAGLLYGVRPGDPATLLAVTLLLAAAALLACLVPARRAARADPMHALRGD